MKRVCVLLRDHAEALEERGILPKCEFHEHVSHAEADLMLGQTEKHSDTFSAGEGWGRCRSVVCYDGVRRITAVPQKEPVRSARKLTRPHPLHYPIPALGDHRIRWGMAFMVAVHDADKVQGSFCAL